MEQSNIHDSYRIYCDGGSRGNPGPAAAAFIVMDEKDKIIFSEGKYLGRTTNNEAEYNAVLIALSWLEKNLKNKKIILFLDSLLVANQLLGKYKIKEERLRELVNKIKAIERRLNEQIIYSHIPRIKNKLADTLVNQTLDKNQQ